MNTHLKNIDVLWVVRFLEWHYRTILNTHYGQQERAFFGKSQTFGLGQTNWAQIFWGILGIFEQFISTNLGAVSPFSMFSINQSLFLQKSLYPNPKYLFGIGDLNVGRKELGI